MYELNRKSRNLGKLIKSIKNGKKNWWKLIKKSLIENNWLKTMWNY